MTGTITLVVDGRECTIPDDGGSLLDALRDHAGVRAVKDGCAPQGQCGCCTVLIDGQPRVACVTAARRVAGRTVTTAAGLPSGRRAAWAACLLATGGSQCGFCTPGIIARLDPLVTRLAAASTASDASVSARPAVDQALLAHLCRCTGWQTVREAAALMAASTVTPVAENAGRDLDAAGRRATIEGRSPQHVAATVAFGEAGFADDTAPADTLVAVLAADGTWATGETMHEARVAAGKVQGRRTTIALHWPVELPPGGWDRTLQTTWVEPAYLEPDAAWCRPGGEPVSSLANGGAFGGKTATAVGAAARELADRHGRPVRALYAREDAVRLGPKRPPLAIGADVGGRGVVRVVRTPGIAAVIAAVAPEWEVEEIDVAGPPTSASLRAAGWAEVVAVLASLGERDVVTTPEGATAEVMIDADGTVHVEVSCGDPLDGIVLRSYCIGAVHQALGMVRSEGVAVDRTGEVHDLTIRSFGILRAQDMPIVEVTIGSQDGAPVNGSDAVFAATLAAAWRHAGHGPTWPAARR